MEEVFQTLVTNMASFAQNVQIHTTAAKERILQLAHTVQQVAEFNPGQSRTPEFKMTHTPSVGKEISASGNGRLN